MKIDVVAVEKPDDVNVILGQSHFVKTVEDLHEALATSAPSIRFGVAFCEASGDRLVRHSGNDAELERLATGNAHRIGAGHSFFLALRGAFPIHVMHAVRAVPEVCRLFCATANPLEVLVATTELGRGIVGVIDGAPPVGVENDAQIAERKALLRRFGYKLA